MEAKDASDVLTLNLRWLCWKKNPNPATWAVVLANLSRFVTATEADSLLRGLKPKPAQLEAIASQTALEVDELLSVPLYAREMSLFHQNLRYLIDCMPQGQGEEAARAIGITPSQLSRWRKMSGRPRMTNVRKLLRFHGMHSDFKIDEVPLFLSLEPLSGYAQKSWVAARVQDMPASAIAEIYPALKKLLQYDD